MASQPSPSPAAKGKNPMKYSPQTAQSQQQQQQQQPRSERAASKAPIAYQSPATQNRHPSPPSSNASKSRTNAAGQKGKASASKIWSTSTTEERERIKDFWLGLGEEERKNLVKIEKDTVLKKMKEQQKHSCSCAVCGRKRFVSFFFHLRSLLCPPINSDFAEFLFTLRLFVRASVACI
jgi:hypothetical protein